MHKQIKKLIGVLCFWIMLTSYLHVICPTISSKHNVLQK